MPGPVRAAGVGCAFGGSFPGNASAPRVVVVDALVGVSMVGRAWPGAMMRT